MSGLENRSHIGLDNPLGIPGLTTGDIIYFNNGVFNRLPIGTTNYVLTVAAGVPSWAAGGGGGGGSPGGSSGQVQYNNSGSFGGIGNTAYSILGNNTSSTSNPPSTLQSFILGTPSYTPSSTTFEQDTTSVNGYAQAILRNSSNGASASADFVAENDIGTDTTNYIDMGINSSGFSGAGPINIASGGYVYTQTGALSVGTVANQTLHLFANNTDAITITGAGAVAISGNPTTTTQSSTDNSTKIATTAYVTTAVNNAIAGVNPAVAVQAATNAILPNSPTYNNGVSGVGATLTDGGTHALVIDGYTVLLNDRVLVKNQGSAFQNGVYTQTTLGVNGVTAWILTRASDYNQPSDMNNTGAIPVVNGTANAATSWVLTSTVNTVGMDAVTFTQFSLNPTTIATLSGNNAFTGNNSMSGNLYQSAGYFEQAIYSNGNSGSTPTIAWDNGNLQSITVNAGATFSFTAPTHPGRFTIIITQDGTGHTYTLPTIKWPGGLAPTLSTAAGAIDIISIIWTTGTTYYGIGNTAFA